MRMMEFLAHIGFWPALGGQLLLTAGTFLLAVAIGFPLGLLAYRYRVLTPPMIGFANFLKILPGFAVFGILMAMGRHSTVTSLLAALFFTILPVILVLKRVFAGSAARRLTPRWGWVWTRRPFLCGCCCRWQAPR